MTTESANVSLEATVASSQRWSLGLKNLNCWVCHIENAVTPHLRCTHNYYYLLLNMHRICRLWALYYNGPTLYLGNCNLDAFAMFLLCYFMFLLLKYNFFFFLKNFLVTLQSLHFAIFISDFWKQIIFYNHGGFSYPFTLITL